MNNVFVFIAAIAILCGQNCIAQQITKESPCAKEYRHLFFEESDKYLGNINPIVDSFQYFYRPDFQCRYLDEDYLLCHIVQINDTIQVDELPFSVEYVKKKDVKVLDVNVEIIEYYKSRDNPLISAFFDEQLFIEEYLGEGNYGLFDYVSYVDSCVRDTSNSIMRLFLLVKNDEMPAIFSFQGEKDSVLCNINRIMENQIYYSDIVYFQSDYNATEFFSLSEWNLFLHHRIDKIVRSYNKKENNIIELDECSKMVIEQ